MKQSLTFLLLLALLRTGALAQTQPATPATGIEFFHGTAWKAVLEEAEKHNKLVFVDVYTDWCGPCKAMAKNTFTDPEVGKFYNKHFVNYKLEAEHGEGPGLSAKWKIQGYPSFVFVNYKGDVVYTSVGYKAPADFIAAGQEALKPTRNAGLARQEVAAGSTEPEKLLLVAMEQARKGEDASITAQRFFETQRDKDLLTPDGWEAIHTLTTDPNSREFKLLVEKRAAFEKIAGVPAVAAKIESVLMNAADEALETEDSQAYKAVVDAARALLKDNGQMAMRLELYQLSRGGTPKDYAAKALSYFTTYTITDVKQLNGAIEAFVQKVDDQAMLAAADRWARQSLALQNSYDTHLLYGRLQAKRGEWFKALGEAKQAMQFPDITPEQQANAQTLVREIQQQIP